MAFFGWYYGLVGRGREENREAVESQPQPSRGQNLLIASLPLSVVFSRFFSFCCHFIFLSNYFSRQIVLLHGVVSCDLSWFDEIFWDYIFFICQIHFSALFWYTLTSLAHYQEREIQKSKQCDKCPDSKFESFNFGWLNLIKRIIWWNPEINI